MNVPPLLSGATLVLWGWQTQWPALGIGAALLIEASRLVTLRVDLSERELARVWGVCWLATLSVALYFIADGDPRVAVTQVLQWLPITLFPMAAAQCYGTLERIPVHVMTFRPPRQSPPLAIDLTYPYLAVCLLAASAANVRTSVFFVAFAALCAWALWHIRSPRMSVGAWSALLVLIVALGYAGQVALNRLQSVVVDLAASLLVGNGSRTDPYRSTTALGQIGERKTSSTIVARVYPRAPHSVPPRLHEATYDWFASPHWYAFDSPLQPIVAPGDGKTWLLGEVQGIDNHFTVATTTFGNRAVLALPWGSLRLADLPVGRLLRNDLGAIEIHSAPQRLRFTVASDSRAARQTWPIDRDLAVPDAEREQLAAIAAELDLAGGTHARAVATLERWFQTEFEYALFQPERTLAKAPLTDFLTTHRAGHCEYFATATVLLLRAAGIPARYATGYAVQEFSEREQAYLVRERHAHAWARVYVDGRWRDVDTTPASWFGVERAQDSLWQPLSDYVSWLLFAYRHWRTMSTPWPMAWIWWLLPPVLGVVAWRLWQRRATPAVADSDEPEQGKPDVPGLDSPFYRIEAALRESGQARRPGELIGMWIARLAQIGAGVPDLAGLRAIAALHYRYRFDPLGLSPAERQRMNHLVDAWLKRFAHASSA